MKAELELRDFADLDTDLLDLGDTVFVEVDGKEFNVVKLHNGLEFSRGAQVARIRGQLGTITRDEPVDLRPYAPVFGGIQSIRGIVKYKLEQLSAPARSENDYGQMELMMDIK